MSRQRLLSEPAAWRAIARHVDVQQYGTYLCWHVQPHYEDKFCVAVSPETRAAMERRIESYVGRSVFGTTRAADLGMDEACLSSAEKNQARVLAALWFALEAEDDAHRSVSSLSSGERTHG